MRDLQKMESFWCGATSRCSLWKTMTAQRAKRDENGAPRSVRAWFQWVLAQNTGDNWHMPPALYFMYRKLGKWTGLSSSSFLTSTAHWSKKGKQEQSERETQGEQYCKSKHSVEINTIKNSGRSKGGKLAKLLSACPKICCRISCLSVYVWMCVCIYTYRDGKSPVQHEQSLLSISRIAKFEDPHELGTLTLWKPN